MKISYEFIQEFVAGLEPSEFTTLRFLVGDRSDKEEAEQRQRIEKLKEGFAFTDTELRLLERNERIEVIKNIRRRFDIGLGDAKRLFDAMATKVQP